MRTGTKNMTGSYGSRYITHTLRGFQILILMFVGPPSAAGQISIENRTSAPVPPDRAWVIYQTACQVVADHYHIKDPVQLQVPFKLKVGMGETNVVYDEGAGVYRINLSEWGDTRFAFAALRLTLQRLITLESRREMLIETLSRAERKLPVDRAKIRAKAPVSEGLMGR
jgi:hypothetical protein